jgi:hypothetical protein
VNQTEDVRRSVRGQRSDFVVDSGVYRQSMEVVKDQCYVGRVSRVGDDPG